MRGVSRLLRCAVDWGLGTVLSVSQGSGFYMANANLVEISCEKTCVSASVRVICVSDTREGEMCTALIRPAVACKRPRPVWQGRGGDRRASGQKPTSNPKRDICYFRITTVTYSEKVSQFLFKNCSKSINFHFFRVFSCFFKKFPVFFGVKKWRYKTAYFPSLYFFSFWTVFCWKMGHFGVILGGLQKDPYFGGFVKNPLAISCHFLDHFWIGPVDFVKKPIFLHFFSFFSTFFSRFWNCFYTFSSYII